MLQPSLFDEPLRLPTPGLTCAFGSPWPHVEPCAGCRAESDRLSASFAAAVAAGKYDAQGYTKNERKAQAKRKAKAAA